jgi:hypothetical protein
VTTVSTSGEAGGTIFNPLGNIMRRRLEIFVPIVLLSILVQLFAPIAAFRVVANAVSDPLYMSSICSGVASSTDGSQTSSGNTHHDGANRCTFCVVGCGGVVALDPAPLVFVTLQHLYQQVSWLKAVDTLPVLRVGSNTQARAPPLLT